MALPLVISKWLRLIRDPVMTRLIYLRPVGAPQALVRFPVMVAGYVVVRAMIPLLAAFLKTVSKVVTAMTFSGVGLAMIVD